MPDSSVSQSGASKLYVRPGWIVERKGDRRPMLGASNEQRAVNEATSLLADKGGEVVVLNAAWKVSKTLLVNRRTD